MTTGEFADLVERMREVQKKYFRNHLSKDLSTSKKLEKQVDTILAERREKLFEKNNPKLF